jgi:hypothetical protein
MPGAAAAPVKQAKEKEHKPKKYESAIKPTDKNLKAEAAKKRELEKRGEAKADSVN